MLGKNSIGGALVLAVVVAAGCSGKDARENVVRVFTGKVCDTEPGGEVAAVASLSDGSIYAVGDYEETTTFGADAAAVTLSVSEGIEQTLYVAKLDPEGELEWLRHVEGADADAVDTFQDDALIVCGRTWSGAVFTDGQNAVTLPPGVLFLARFEPDGELGYARSVGHGDEVYPESVNILADGSMVVQGMSRGEVLLGEGDEAQSLEIPDFQPDFQPFLASYDRVGTILWGEPIGEGAQSVRLSAATDTSFIAHITHFDSLKLGSGADAAWFAGSEDGGFVLAEYGYDGSLIRARVGGRGCNGGTRGRRDGSLVMVGGCAPGGVLGEGSGQAALPTADGSGKLIATFTRGGRLGWVMRPFEGDGSTSFRLSPAEDIVLFGSFPGFLVVEPDDSAVELSTGTIHVSYFDRDGALAWARSVTTKAIADMGLSEDGSVVLTGSTARPAVFGEPPDEHVVINVGGEDALSARFDPAGELQWVDRVGGAGADWGKFVLPVTNDVAVVVGRYTGRAIAGQAGGTELAANGADQWFIAKHGADGSVEWARELLSREASVDESLSQFDHLFDCPSEIAEPVEAVAYKNPWQVRAAFDRLRSTAAWWVDADCLSTCELGPQQTACIEGSCTGANGAAVEYYYSKEAESDTYSGGIVEVESLTVSPPQDSETWSELTTDIWRDYDWGDEHLLDEYEHSASWQGEMTPLWPPDYSVLGSYTYEASDYWFYYGSVWGHDSCNIVSEDLDLNVNELDHRLVLGLNLIEIDWDSGSYTGWINGECIAEIDDKTWETIGPCP